MAPLVPGAFSADVRKKVPVGEAEAFRRESSCGAEPCSASKACSASDASSSEPSGTEPDSGTGNTSGAEAAVAGGAAAETGSANGTETGDAKAGAAKAGEALSTAEASPRGGCGVVSAFETTDPHCWARVGPVVCLRVPTRDADRPG